MLRSFWWVAGLFILCGCAAFFGWDIHAPGLLSSQFYQSVSPVPLRVALYLPPSALAGRSTNRGGWLADPQTYYIGEALGPMALEAFQQAFDEFIFLETEPDAALLARYGIAYAVVLDVKGFRNRVTMKGQAVELETEAQVYDQALKLAVVFKSTGSSDAQKVFAKKGGPEVNLNAAIENNLTVVVQSLQDFIEHQKVI